MKPRRRLQTRVAGWACGVQACGIDAWEAARRGVMNSIK
jgi:hypothetical protein